MPRFAVMTFMFKPWWQDGRVTHEELIEGLAAEGVQGIEPFHRDFVEDPALLKRTRRALADSGLHVAAVDVMCNLVHANGQQKREERDTLRQGLDVCKELGTEIAHVAGHRLRDGVTPDDGRKMIADGLLDAAGLADEYGLVLAIEDFGISPDLVCTAQDCIEIMRMTGDVVKFVFDTGNFAFAGEGAEENFDLLADRIVHCHFKDFVQDAESGSGLAGCDLGDGVIPNAAVARRLMERDYDGWIALETRARDDTDPVAAVRMELPRLKSWFRV